MSTADNISLKLSFNQVVPDEQQKKLIDIIKKKSAKPQAKALTEKEALFLHGLDESVDYVNNYKAGGINTPSLTDILNAL